MICVLAYHPFQEAFLTCLSPAAPASSSTLPCFLHRTLLDFFLLLSTITYIKLANNMHPVSVWGLNGDMSLFPATCRTSTKVVSCAIKLLGYYVVTHQCG